MCEILTPFTLFLVYLLNDKKCKKFSGSEEWVNFHTLFFLMKASLILESLLFHVWEMLKISLVYCIIDNSCWWWLRERALLAPLSPPSSTPHQPQLNVSPNIRVLSVINKHTWSTLTCYNRINIVTMFCQHLLSTKALLIRVKA